MNKRLIASLAFLSLLFAGAAACLAAPPASMNHGHAGQFSDRAFLSGMIGHHQGAVDMSTKILATTKDEQIKDWARDIIEDQNKEIKQMQTMLGGMGGLDKAAHDTMLRMDMSAYKGKDPDSAFVAAMFAHHKDALSMSISALMYSDNREVIKLAEDIIKNQADEMAGFRFWGLAKQGK